MSALRRFASALFALSLAASLAPVPAFADKTKRLEAREKDHYDALRVWLSPEERKAYLKLKTPELRDEWLKTHGSPSTYWDRFYQYSEAEREMILSGDVKPGWKQDQLFMAWGEPAEQTRVSGGRNAEYSERMIYRFEVDKDGNAYVWVPDSNETYKAVELYRVELILDDRVVAEMKKIQGWGE